MTTAFLARYSKKQKQTILIIEEGIPKDWESVDPSDDSHTGPSMDMFPEPLTELCAQGDVFVTQNSEILMLTVQFRNGCTLDVRANKAEHTIEVFEVSPDIELPEDINQMVMFFIDYMIAAYSNDEGNDQ